MDGPNSIHNVPPQLDLPAHANWQKQQRKRKPAPPATDETDAAARESPADTGAAQGDEVVPKNRDVGTQIDIEA